MKKIDSSNHLQNEALLNEYKGNIFEFLVANQLSRLLNKESNFLFNLNHEFKVRLSMYEEFLRLNYPEILMKLFEMAKKTAEEIFNLPDIQLIKDKLEIHLIGKSVATNDNSLWGETDLVLLGPKENLKLSLKLSKDHSYTNTKSAGIKSFVSKYFSSFENAEKLQLELNHEVDFQFQKMGQALYQQEGLVFHGQFDQEWRNSYTELPGELNSEHRAVVFANYSAINFKLYQIIKGFYAIDKTKFLECLFPLMGLSQQDIIQVTTYHRDHILDEVKIFSWDNKQTINLILADYKENSHSFDVLINQIILQIRIKPMNKFTTASYKVNCSIKS